MLASEELPDIYSDLFDLDLLKDSSVKDVDEFALMRAVTVTRHIGDSSPPRNVALRTSFGRMVYETMQTGVEFGTITPGPEDDGNPPIVVTHQNTPVAVIKGLGEATAYVLRGSSSHGLIERTIALPGRPIDPQFLPRDVPAHRVELNKIGRFTAVRFALTALPSTTIAAVQNDGRRSTRLFEHAAMLTHAEYLTGLARPVLGRELSEAILDTADDYDLEL
jgi:hypothetical protein